MNDVTQRMADRVRRIEISTRRLSSEAFHGGVQSRFRGRGMDFDEVREYEPGDDVRAIDWKATARAGHTFVKKYREERQLTVVFVVDVSASGSLGSGDSSKREQAIEMAGVLALAAVRSDHRIGLAAFTDSVEVYVPPARGRAHAFRLVSNLVALEPKGRGTNLASALRLVRDRLKRRAVVVILSDFLLGRAGIEEAGPELRALAQRHDVVAIRVGDRLDRELPATGLLTLEDAETGEVVEIDTRKASNRLHLDAIAKDTDERIRALARSAHVDLLEVDTMRPYLGPLIGFFRARGGSLMKAAIPSVRSACLAGAGVLGTLRCTTALAAVSPADDIRDIRPLILIPSWWHWVVIGLVVALVLASAIVAFRLWRRRSARPLTPEEQARQALTQAEALARQGLCREWADVVAPALRSALATKLNRDVCPQTTAELATAAWMQPPNAIGVDGPRLLDLLSTCDLTRFAMGRLDADSLLASTAFAREWVAHLFAASEPASTTSAEVPQ